MERSAVIYTDGSFRPNCEGTQIGFWGSGAHGYIFTDDKSVKTVSDKPTKFVITNQGYIRNEELNKYKDTVQEVKPIMYIDACYSFLNKGTVNTGELSAVIELLKDIINKNEILQLNNILIKSDSMYVIYECNKILEHTETVEEKDKPNIEFLEELKKVLEEIRNKKINFSIEKVKGHSDDPGNDIADILAVYARIQSSNRNIIRIFNIHNYEDGNKYWNFTLNRHPMLEYRQLFFTNSLRGTNSDVFYSILDYKTDKEPGTKTHEACFGLVKLVDRQDIIEDTISEYHKACNHMSIISTLDLNLLYGRLNSYYFNLLGPSIYNFVYGKYSLNTFNKAPIVHAIRPPGLATQALERTQYLHYLISEYKNANKNEKSLRKFIDITDRVYQVVEDKKKNKKWNTIIPPTAEYIEIDVEYKNMNTVKVFVILGKDTLSRNQFKHLEKDEPKIFLVTEMKSEDAMNYYTLIETKNGDIGVFCNFYSGKVLLNKKKINK